MTASVDSIESMGMVDGPGIRTVIFFNGCKLRCKYCHNPEMWIKKNDNYTKEELFQKIIRNKNYFGNNGGVTFSGGEPLLHIDFLIELSKMLKEENINICLDTAGVGIGKYNELLPFIDLVILDIKHVLKEEYLYLTGSQLNEVEKFIESCNKCHKKMWIRQVVIPDFNDTYEYMDNLVEYLKKINNIEKVEFLPFHRLGKEKYDALNISYPFNDKSDMCEEKSYNLYEYFLKKYNEKE